MKDLKTNVTTTGDKIFIWFKDRHLIRYMWYQLIQLSVIKSVGLNSRPLLRWFRFDFHLLGFSTSNFTTALPYYVHLSSVHFLFHFSVLTDLIFLFSRSSLFRSHAHSQNDHTIITTNMPNSQIWVSTAHFLNCFLTNLYNWLFTVLLFSCPVIHYFIKTSLFWCEAELSHLKEILASKICKTVLIYFDLVGACLSSWNQNMSVLLGWRASARNV